MRISYAVTVCNELVEIQRLLPFLIKNKRQEDEIVVSYDSNNGSKGVEDYLRAQSQDTFAPFRFIHYHFDGHFANMKNALTEACLGDYIFHIYADEMPSTYLLEHLPAVLEMNSLDVILVPRVNTVTGLTLEHIQKWNWAVNEKGWVNFPDYQWRIYRRSPDIKWVSKVHEFLNGFKTASQLPPSEEWCLLHDKTIQRQEKQNAYYETL